MLGIICRYDNSGLATLAREFARHLKPHKVLLVENGVFQTFPERYSEIPNRVGMTKENLEWFYEGTTSILSFETFYDWMMIKRTRELGIKTILYTMCEMSRESFPLMPDVLLCPSKLDYDIFKHRENAVFVPVPVATDRLEWRAREEAKVFIHTASHGGVNGRKGTGLLLEAMNHAKSNIKLIIYSWQPFTSTDPRVEVRVKNFLNYWECWEEGDVLIYPQGANGICLPIIEAMSSGMGVITTDQYPFNEYMYRPYLFKPQGFVKRSLGKGLIPVDDPVLDPVILAAKIDEVAGQDLREASWYGKKWAQENSWEKLGPEIEKICKQ